MTLEDCRRFYSEEIRLAANISSRTLVEAFCSGGKRGLPRLRNAPLNRSRLQFHSAWRSGGAPAKGLVRHNALSNVTAAQIAEARPIAPIVRIQNHYNFVLDPTKRSSSILAVRPSPMCLSFHSAGSAASARYAVRCRAGRLGITPVQCDRVAASTLAEYPGDPGTILHRALRENLAARPQIQCEVIADLDSIRGDSRGYE